MGAWGPGLFSDDLALDVRGDYRELIEDGVADAEATRRILERYAESMADSDEAPTFWLALAFTQSKLGRLDPGVKKQALIVLERGDALQPWMEDPKLRAKREVALAKVEAQLKGPQPTRKKLRPPSRHVTDLAAGDVLLFRGSGRCALLRVARIDDHRLSVAPILVALEYDGAEPPRLERVEQLSDRLEPSPIHSESRDPWSETRWRPMVVNRADYRDAGFEHIGRIASRPGDEAVQSRIYTSWQNLAITLSNFLKN